MEIERKFLIVMPSFNVLNVYGIRKTYEIVQTYLKTKQCGVERRVRRREDAFGVTTFFYTEKSLMSHGVREEKERQIDRSEYLQLLTEANESLQKVVKTRYCFNYNGQLFELDIYPFSKTRAILEIELNDINEEVKVPPYVQLIKEVTGDDKYSNASLAKYPVL